ncbi:MAG: transposase [Spirochaetota bacterium]|nr:transposase [Spirochaetota bacterium]
MRKPRYLQIGADYHVTAKINRGEFALEPQIIKEMFLHTVKKAKMKFSFRLKNFVLMDNHIHLLIKPGKDENLSKIMQWILSVFAKSYNKYFNLTGHVWQDRFKSKIIESFHQLLATFRYICNNPVKAEMVETPEEYLYGALWYIRRKWFDIVEPPDLSIKMVLSDL